MSSSSPPKMVFNLSGTDAGFGSRMKDVFASLDTIEAKHAAVVLCDTAERLKIIKADPIVDDDDEDDLVVPVNVGAASFKKPSVVPPRSHKELLTTRDKRGPDGLPGHLVNPANWKRYDLSDVTPNQMSEGSNQKAAAEFLASFKRKREENTIVEDAASSEEQSGKHVFKRPSSKTKNDGNSLSFKRTKELPPNSEALPSRQDRVGYAVNFNNEEDDDEEEEENMEYNSRSRAKLSTKQTDVVSMDVVDISTPDASDNKDDITDDTSSKFSTRKATVRKVRKHDDDDDNDDDLQTVQHLRAANSSGVRSSRKNGGDGEGKGEGEGEEDSLDAWEDDEGPGGDEGGKGVAVSEEEEIEGGIDWGEVAGSFSGDIN